jgi:hypothetical protein
MNLGRIIGEPDTIYHGGDCISHSRLETFRRRPALYYKRHVGKTLAGEDSAAFALGRAVHASVLQRGLYENTFVTKPDGIDRRTKEGKARFESFCAEAAGKTIIDGEEASLVEEMTAAVHAHPSAAMLLRKGEAEVTWRVQSKALPHPLQCRTDWFCAEGCELTEGRPYVADVKTCESLDGDAFRNFERAFWAYGYARQCGFYLPLLHDLGVTCRDFLFVAVEKVEPFGVIVYRASDEAIAVGQDETLRDLTALAQCYKTGRWPNTPTEVQEITLPGWYLKREEAA